MSAFALADGVVYHTYPPIRADWMPSGGLSARPRAEGTQRDRALVPAPRRVRQGLTFAGRTGVCGRQSRR